MDEILTTFEQLETRYLQATRAGEYEKRFEIVEEARDLYKALRPCQQRTVVVAYPQWMITLRPSLL